MPHQRQQLLLLGPLRLRVPHHRLEDGLLAPRRQLVRRDERVHLVPRRLLRQALLHLLELGERHALGRLLQQGQHRLLGQRPQPQGIRGEQARLQRGADRELERLDAQVARRAQQRHEQPLLHRARPLVQVLEQGLKGGGGHIGEGGRVGVAPLGLEEPLEVRRARRQHHPVGGKARAVGAHLDRGVAELVGLPQADELGRQRLAAAELDERRGVGGRSRRRRRSRARSGRACGVAS